MKSIFVLMLAFGVVSSSAHAANLLDKAKAAKEAAAAAVPAKPATPAEPAKPGLTDQIKGKAATVEGEFKKGQAQVKDLVSPESAPAEKAATEPAKAQTKTAKKAKKTKAKKHKAKEPVKKSQ